MKEIKIDNRVSKTQASEIREQLANNTVLILDSLPTEGKVIAKNIIGKVMRFLPLNSKTIVHVDLHNEKFKDEKSFKFAKLSDGYVLYVF